MSKKLIAGIVAAAVVLVAVLVGVQVLGGDDAPTAAADFEGREEVAALFEGIPQKGTVLGRADAPVTIVEYVDYKCPICARASEETVPELVERYVRTGQAKLELRPIAFIGPDSERGALAGEAAALQNRMWQFTELMMRNQGDESDEWITDAVVIGAAEAAGLDRGRFEEDYREDETIVEAFAENEEQAQSEPLPEGSSGFGTPFWSVSGPGGSQTFSGVQDIAVFDAAVTRARGAGS